MTPTLLLILALVSASLALHQEPAPLRGYTCKPSTEQDAQRPCELCPIGFFCRDEHTMLPCGGADVFCPIGSVEPTPVSDGFYTVGLAEDAGEERRGDQKQCEAGHFCVGGISRVCPEGFYCPDPGTTAPLECGNPSVFCEEGSVQPTQVRQGFFSIGGTNSTRTGQQEAPPGHYASGGIVKPCREGHFGSSEGLFDDSCDGICEAGWFCPEASISPNQFACGGPEHYCPPGSSAPKLVQVGHYTSTEEEPCGPGLIRDPSHTDELSEVSPIALSRTKGECVPCQEGTYSPHSGDDAIKCKSCGSNAESTPERITCACHQSATDRAKFGELYFDPHNSTCYYVSEPPPDDVYEAGMQFTKSKEVPCDEGHFCREGIRYKCRGGRYGESALETNEDCSGPCAAGHWCGEASTRPTQNQCGGPHVYCPAESASPIYTSEGYYTDEDDPQDAKTTQHLCPPGFFCQEGLRHPCEAGSYGASAGLSDESCDGSCLEGYFCPSASVSPTQHPCGNSTVYCPAGSKLPSLVQDGYYSAPENEVVVADYYSGPNSTQQIQVQCEVRYFCQGGVKYSCPAGTFGSKPGASEVSDCEPCRPGTFCPSHPGPPTVEGTQHLCGDAHVYCPEGSSEPLDVDLGHYSITEYEEAKEDPAYADQRTAQVECQPGYWCEGGIKRPCPSGTYGEASGLASDACSGLCPRGYFCPEASLRPLRCAPGAYSTGGASDCTSCEVPASVPADVINSMCRDDRSCCLDVFG